MSVVRAAIVGVLLATLGCADERPRSMTGPPSAPQSASIAELISSDTAPRAGATVTLTARVRPGARSSSAASYKAHSTYEPAGLAFVDAPSLPIGVRALNSGTAGTIVAAGAAPKGFTDGRLFAVRFLVTDPSALRRVTLAIEQLGGSDFRDQLPSLATRSGIHATAGPP